MSANEAAALAYAQKGVPVLPLHWPEDGACSCGDTGCGAPGKHPLSEHGKDDATTDPEIIRGWWARWPKANIGLRMGGGRVALDVDPRNGGDESLHDLGPLPDTVTALTGGGGQHLIFRADGAIPDRKGVRPGLDIIASGYIVAPPSRHVSGGRYEWEIDHAPGQITLAPLPPVLVELARDGRGPAEPLPERICEGQRNAALTSLAGSMRRRGASPEAIEAALQLENESRCDPPLPSRDVRRIAASVGRYEPAPPDGNRATPSAAPPFEALGLDELLAEPDAALEAVIGDGGEGAILTRDGKGFVAGPTGVGKTNLLLRLSRCLCEGSPFLDLPIASPRRVLYAMLEGSRRGLRRRLRKVWEGAAPDARERFALAFITLNLANEGDLGRLEGLLAEVRPDVVILDPLRNAHTWDENLSHEAARLTGILDALIDRYHVALILAHHDRKRPPFVRRDAGTDRVRGSTALTGWLQFCLSLDSDPKTPDLLLAEWTKTRDAEIALPPMVLEFDRGTLDFLPSERVPGGKVSDDAILNAVYLNGGSYRGPDLVAGLMEGCGASERTVRERLRALVKAGRLIQYVAPGDKDSRAKSYSLPDGGEGEQ